MVGTTVDITERKRAEESLRRSESYLAEAERLTHTGSYAGDSTTQPLYWSEELYRIFGLDPQQGLPTREQPLERVHPEDLDKLLQAFSRVIDERVDSEVELQTRPAGRRSQMGPRDRPSRFERQWGVC